MATEAKGTVAQTLDQRRAAHAWRVVQAVKKLPSEQQREFGREARRLPARIVTSGLGQALLFLKAKGYAEPLRHALSTWILAERDRRGPRPEEADALLSEILRRDASFLRLATAEALAYAQWLARFADAEGLMDANA